jgi:hypothetical protein
MPYLVAYAQELYWLSLPLFLAVWYALAWTGHDSHLSAAPVHVRQRTGARRCRVWYL